MGSAVQSASLRTASHFHLHLSVSLGRQLRRQEAVYSGLFDSSLELDVGCQPRVGTDMSDGDSFSLSSLMFFLCSLHPRMRNEDMSYNNVLSLSSKLSSPLVMFFFTVESTQTIMGVFEVTKPCVQQMSLSQNPCPGIFRGNDRWFCQCQFVFRVTRISTTSFKGSFKRKVPSSMIFRQSLSHAFCSFDSQLLSNLWLFDSFSNILFCFSWDETLFSEKSCPTIHSRERNWKDTG